MNTAQRFGLAAAAPTVALLFAVITSAIVLLASGSNPLEAFSEMINHARRLETIIDILNRATPLYLSGVAAAIGFKMNLFNIGVEGQYRLAALIAAFVGAQVALPGALHVGLILLTAMVVGAAYSGFAGVLKVTRGVNEVISTIMLNLIAISGIIAALVRRWQAGGEVDASDNSVGVGTEPIAESGIMPDLNGVVELFTREIGSGKSLTGIFAVAIVVGILYSVLLSRTRFGFDLRASGLNPFAAHAGGVPPKRMVVSAMVLSGAVAGLVGMASLMTLGRFSPNFVGGLGFAGIATSLLGRNHPVGIALSLIHI